MKTMYFLNLNVLVDKLNLHIPTVQFHLAALACSSSSFQMRLRQQDTPPHAASADGGVKDVAAVLQDEEAKQSLASPPLAGKWPSVEESVVPAERRFAPR